MDMTLAHAIRVLETQTREDPALAEAVLFMAQDATSIDPIGDVPAGALRVAQRVNERRLREHREALAGGGGGTTEETGGHPEGESPESL